MKSAILLALLSPMVHAATDDVFIKDIRPLLDRYCTRCHGAQVQTAGINFARFPDSSSILHDLPLWRKVLAKVQSNEMPPAAPLPADEERERLVHWVQDALRRPDWDKVRNAGEVPLPRLNRVEYNNTIRDLTGIDLHPADAFPADPAGESGFNNDREGLFLSPLLVEKYLSAAGFVAEEVIAAHRHTQPFHSRLEVEDMHITEMNTPKKPYGYDLVVTQNTIYQYVNFPRSGTYTFRVRAWGRSDNPDRLPGVALRVAGELAGQEQVAASAAEPAIYTFTRTVPRGSHRVSLHYFSAVTAMRSAGSTKPPDDPKANPVLSLDWLEIDDAADRRTLETGSRIFISKSPRQILERFASRAWRRPAAKSEVDALTQMFQQATRKGLPFDAAIGEGLKAALVSPNFLFRIEGSGSEKAAYRLNDYELASRLSYFLWMSMPDDELFQLAREKRLRSPGVLAAQVRRMVKDPKSDVFISQFFGQWLGYGELGRSGGPDNKLFRSFNDYLRDSMLAESNLFLGSLVRDDQSLLQMLDSDYTYLNEELARHYGIPGVLGRQMRRVELQDRNRGGVIGMGSVLTATSLPVRTSPVLRGKWLLEEVLGEKVPPPPANAGDLPEPSKETASMTLRQRFELHRQAPQCASCHNRLDPLGYGLENFDAIGRWRDQDNGRPVDSAGVLTTGEHFSGPRELKSILLKRKEAFAEVLARKALAFALGRSLRYYDEPVTNKIAHALIVSDWRPSSLLLAVAESYPFQFQQPAPSQEHSE
jgi:hypothetical protein